MNYRMVATDGGVEVSLEGVLNFAANDDFLSMLRALSRDRPKSVIFDLSGLTGIDSVGLGLLYIAHEDIAGMGAALTLSSARDSVARLLDLTEAHKTFRVIA